jgi:trehalose 6-phosphate synthase
MSPSPEQRRTASMATSESTPISAHHSYDSLTAWSGGETGLGDARSPERLPKVVALASRPPVTPSHGAWKPAPGGLAPIVSRALGQRGGAWLSWNGAAGTEQPPQDLPGLDYRVFTFTLGRADAEGFYGGYSNRTLWPLFHDMVVPPVFRDSWWPGYVSANQSFAVAAQIASERVGDRPTIWVHDYHLMLVPEKLRALGVTNPVSFFLHTPFPSPAIFGRLPRRDEILAGLGGADLIGFQTEADRHRFASAWSRGGMGRCPATIAVPASIDAEVFRHAATDPANTRRASTLRKRLGDRVLLFGVERLDYTKGIPEKLRALEVLFERRNDLRRRVVYVQVAHPSRERVPEYQKLRAKVERQFGRLNGRFTDPGHDVPFRYLHRSVSAEQLMAYYLAADVALVTPLRDGMNLVAKEYVTVQAAAKGNGALVLSEFAGAAVELSDALHCNPYDPVGTADAIERAIEMSDEERRKRLSIMAVQVENNDITHWADQLLRTAEGVSQVPTADTQYA